MITKKPPASSSPKGLAARAERERATRERAVFYMAHPVGGPTPEDVARNVANAHTWLRWLRLSFPETTFIAPWLASIASGDDDFDPAQREAAMVDAEAVVSRCTGLVHVGGRVSTGMRREAACAYEEHDLTFLGSTPPPQIGVFRAPAGSGEGVRNTFRRFVMDVALGLTWLG